MMAVAVSEADAARRLGLSVHTVHEQLRNARSRLGVRTTRQAVGVVAHRAILYRGGTETPRGKGAA